jgi:hypothetical protein
MILGLRRYFLFGRTDDTLGVEVAKILGSRFPQKDVLISRADKL